MAGDHRGPIWTNSSPCLYRINGRFYLWCRYRSNLRFSHHDGMFTISLFANLKDFLRRFAQFRGNDVYEFSNAREGLIVGLLSIGCLFGALAAAPLSDYFGRRRNMILACCIFYVGNTIQITSMHAWYQLAIGRFICGLAVGALSGIFLN